MKRTSLLTALLLVVAVAVGCASTAVHPGAVNRFDSQTYDALVSSQAAIEEARAMAPTLTPDQKTLINRAVAAYNLALDAYLAYHGAAASGGVPDQTALDLQVQALIADIIQLRSAFPKGGPK